MLSLLSPLFNSFRIKIPEYFFAPELREKYALLYGDDKTILQDPVEFLNQTIVAIDFLGLAGGTIQQDLTSTGYSPIQQGTKTRFGQEPRIDMNRFKHPSTLYSYRSAKNVLSLIDKSFKITFRHTLGFWNYFMLFELFIYQTLRDSDSDSEMFLNNMKLDILDPRTGMVLSSVTFIDSLIDNVDSLTLSTQLVHPDSKEFSVTFKFNNIDYQFAPHLFDNETKYTDSVKINVQ